MKKFLGSLALAAGLVVLGASGAQAATGFDPDTGIVTVDNTGGAGASYEFTSALPVHNGDTITFEYRSDDVTCAGGVPRVFIQGGAYNTFDVDPAGPLACGTDADGDGWFTVTQTITGITDGAAGLVGFVNDNPADPGTIEFRNLEINGTDLLPASPKDACRNGGWESGGYKNQGQCVSAIAKASRA